MYMYKKNYILYLQLNFRKVLLSQGKFYIMVDVA